MAILTMFEIHGDPDEIVAVQKEKIVPEARRIARRTAGSRTRSSVPITASRS
jgi:hypothetical protein